MMESKTGSLLTLIAAVIHFVIAGIIFLISLVFFVLAFIPNAFEMGVSFSPLLISFILLLVGFLVLILGLLFKMASRKMKNKKTVRNGAIWAIVLGVLTLGQIAGILSLIGGIIALIDADK